MGAYSDFISRSPEGLEFMRSYGLEDMIPQLDGYFESRLAEGLLDGSAPEELRDMVLSDEREKYFDEVAGSDKWSRDDLKYLNRMIAGGKDFMSRSDDDSAIDSWDEDTLQAYARHLRNYLYTYKESAKETDPTLDTHELHNGPMAQDIEKVAPDCVKETEDGVKVVDGNRLALVNAGVIGDLTRKILHLESEIHGKNALPARAESEE